MIVRYENGESKAHHRLLTSTSMTLVEWSHRPFVTVNRRTKANDWFEWFVEFVEYLEVRLLGATKARAVAMGSPPVKNKG